MKTGYSMTGSIVFCTDGKHANTTFFNTNSPGNDTVGGASPYHLVWVPSKTNEVSDGTTSLTVAPNASAVNLEIPSVDNLASLSLIHI